MPAGILPSRFARASAAATPPSTPPSVPAPPAPVTPAPVAAVPVSPVAPPAAPAVSSVPPATPPTPRTPRRAPTPLEELEQRVLHIEVDWPDKIIEEVRAGIEPVSTALSALTPRVDRAEQALGQLGARLDAVMQRVDAIERLNLSNEIATLRGDVDRLGRIQTAMATAAAAAPAPSATPPPSAGAAGPATSFAAYFPGVPTASRSPLLSRRALMIGGILMIGATLVVLGVLASSAISDRVQGWVQRGPSVETSSANRLPTEEEGPAAAGEVLSGDTEVVGDEVEGPRGEGSPPSSHTEGSSSKSGGSSVGADSKTAAAPTTTVAASSAPAAASPDVVASSYPARAPKSHRTFKVKGADLTIDVGEEIIGGWADGELGIDWSAIASSSASSFTVRDVKPGHYHWNVETLSGWRLETEGSQFRLNAAVSINGQAIPVGTGRPHDKGDGANFCVTVLP